MSFFVVANANQAGNRYADMVDIYSESTDKKTKAVWGMVHVDFFHDTGLQEVFEKLTKNLGSGFPPIELEVVTVEELKRLKEIEFQYNSLKD